MPNRTDMFSILAIGDGPTVVGPVYAFRNPKG